MKLFDRDTLVFLLVLEAPYISKLFEVSDNDKIKASA